MGAASGFDLPVGLKPLLSHVWAEHRPEKLLLARDPEELRELGVWAFDPGVPMLMTEWVVRTRIPPGGGAGLGVSCNSKRPS